MVRKTLTEIKNELLSIMIKDEALVKSLVIMQDNFLSDSVLIDDNTQYLLNNPNKLIRDRIFPYKKNLNIETESKVIISMTFTNFEPQGKYRDGYVNFYILCPYKYEKTNYGIRYDWIADELESLLSNNGIGNFEFDNRSDININDNFLGHMISFKILDFWLVK